MLLFLGGCTSVPARLSAVVAFTDQAGGIDGWLTAPGRASIEAAVRFPATLGEDVIFGLDAELLDGIADPLYVAEGDWMAFVGVQRTGAVWVAVGTDATMAGEPSKDRTWEILDLGAPLLPDTWYTFRTVADYGERRFVSFTVQGPDLDVTLDLSAHTLDFPNAIPFDRRAMTWYVHAMRGKSLAEDLSASAEVEFDDVRGGWLAADDDTVTVSLDNGCEGAAGAVPEQPIDLWHVPETGIPVGDYDEGAFYLERGSSRCRVAAVPDARSGANVCACDATLAATGYDAWLEARGG